MTATVHPRNPLRTYAFHLKVDGAVVAGLRKVSGLSMSVEANETWEAGNRLYRYAHPDRATWQPIVLEQGLALNDTLERWARATVDFLHTGLAPGEKVKRNAVLEVWDPQAAGSTWSLPGSPDGDSPQEPDTGPRHRSYDIFNAWISRFEAIPSLDAMGDEVGLLVVELTHEGWRKSV
ncbi:MAG: phage tail protein [Acidimicrobiales bacterium]